MDTLIPPAPVERESKKILFGVIVAVGILLYAAFNVWVWRWSKPSTHDLTVGALG